MEDRMEEARSARGGAFQALDSKNGIQVRRGGVRADRKTMEEARSARCPKEQIQRGHADVAERRAG